MLNLPHRKLVTLLPFLVITTLFSACGQAQMQGNQTQGPQISVSGSGKVTAEADQATVNLNLSAQAADSAGAKNDVDKRINAFFDAIQKLGIKDEQITAGSMSLNPQYDYQNRKPRFIGFQANRSISVELNDLEKIHPVLDAAVALKINGIQGIQYASSAEEKMREQARLAAIEDSKQKAKQMAEAYGAKLGPVYSISYHSGNIDRPYAQPEIRALAMSDNAAPSGRFIPGEISVQDRISVVFDLITQ